MAAKTTAKVATLTGAAKDDVLGGGSEDGTIADLAVLANDPGAANLWSLDQGVPGLPGGTQVVSNLAAWTLASGAVISAGPGGTIHYDGSGMNLQHLAQGASYTDHFIYTVRMANGALSTANVSVVVTGVNDAPTLIAPAAATITDTPAAEVQASVGGSLAGSDVDDGAVLTYSLVGSGGSGYGTMAVNADGTWSFADDPGAVDALGAGDTAQVTFQAVVTDEHGASSAAVNIVVNLVGVNDIADVTGDDSGSVTEDGTLVASGDLDVADRDADESAFGAVGSLAGTYGDFTFDSGTGAWTYALRNGDANVQALNSGDTVSDSLVVASLDGSDSLTVTVNINGADEPASPPPPPPPETEDKGPKFMFSFGDWESEHNVFNGFTNQDTLFYSAELTQGAVTFGDYDNDGDSDDAAVNFTYTGHKPGSTPVEIQAILIGVSFNPDVESVGHA
jgi:VCBS repeat-containing protein